MQKTIINTDTAPEAIGPYSQAIKVDNTVYLSGQIPIDPDTKSMIEGGFAAQAIQVFRNLSEVAEAAGGSLADAVKLTVYLTDFGDFAELNEIMTEYCTKPYPARATVHVSGLPKGALIEVDAVLCVE